jgi:pSer/pThr/pTyr-binding forkhead associated (FHA) protein
VRSRILLGLIAGTIGGLLGAILQELFIDHEAVMRAFQEFGSVPAALGIDANRKIALFVGGLVGLCLGAVNGIVEGNSRKIGSGIAIGAIAGAILGYVGLFLGEFAFALLGGNNSLDARQGMFAFARQVIARTFGWAFMGLGIGVGAGLSTRSPKRIFHGAVGGFLGGFIGGFVFDIVASMTNPVDSAFSNAGVREIGGPSRMIGFTVIGGLTGFFIGLVEELLKQAWVKVLAGKNEGKDFILSRPMNILGRDERSDVPLYGDINIMPQHFAIRADSNRHVLIDAGTQAGTVVNGQRVPPGGELLLRDGDMIQAGTHRILFREKATASKFARDPVDAPKSAAPGPSNVPMPSHLCPFCGGTKDASGNCRCSVGGAPVGASGMGMTSPGFGGDLGMNPGSAGYGGGMASGMNAYPAPGGYGAASAGGVIMPRLVGMEGPYTGQVFLLTNMNNVLGREPDKDIVLSADPTVSRNHARIVNENGDFVVYDNGAANGTFVNSLRVSMQVLAPGDIVQFGSSKFRFE